MRKNKGEKTKKVSRSPIKIMGESRGGYAVFLPRSFWGSAFYTYAPRSATGRVYWYQIRL